jgi:hypothetical protein
MRKTNIRDLAKPRVVRQSRKSQKWLEKTGTVFRTKRLRPNFRLFAAHARVARHRRSKTEASSFRRSKTRFRDGADHDHVPTVTTRAFPSLATFTPRYINV